MLGNGDVNGGKDRAAARLSASGAALGPTTRACFAGLGLSLEGDPELCARWQRAAGGGPASSAASVSGVRLRCRLHALPPGATPTAGGLHWVWQEPCGRVRAPLGEARVQREHDGYAAQVQVAREPHAARLLLVGLASLLLGLEGGLILHAASVALDGEAVAFIGPSGAGKSTACRHVVGGVPFSVDRLALLPATAARPWLAHPVPGGSASERELGASARWLPLRAVLRVQASALGSRLEACPAAIAVLLARESAFQLGQGSAAELALLGSLERLIRDVGVQRLHVQLGHDLEPLLPARRPHANEGIT